METILIIYAIANALIIYYFIIYKNRQADKEYNEQLRRITDRGSHVYTERGSHYLLERGSQGKCDRGSQGFSIRGS